MRQAALPAGVSLLVLLLWETAVWLTEVKPIVLPAPSLVLTVAVANAATLGVATTITMVEAVSGFLIACVAAVALAMVFVHSRLVKDALYPYAIAVKATPIIAIAPLIVLWAGNGLLSKIIMAALVAFFPVLVNAVQGLAALDEEVVELAHSVNASPWTVLWRLRVPASLPYLFPGLRVASTLAVVGAVIGEFTGATSGVGHLIARSSYYFETPLVFAAIGCTAFGGLAFFGAIALLERRVVFWKKPAWD